MTVTERLAELGIELHARGPAAPWQMPSSIDDHGLVPALASQVANFGERTGIRTTFHRHGELPELSDEEQLVLYRVAQESLSNVVQHSGASAVRVELGLLALLDVGIFSHCRSPR